MMSTVGRFPINDGARLAPFMEGGHRLISESYYAGARICLERVT